MRGRNTHREDDASLDAVSTKAEHMYESSTTMAHLTSAGSDAREAPSLVPLDSLLVSGIIAHVAVQFVHLFCHQSASWHDHKVQSSNDAT
jgi:hypothetical protein